MGVISHWMLERQYHGQKSWTPANYIRSVHFFLHLFLVVELDIPWDDRQVSSYGEVSRPGKRPSLRLQWMRQKMHVRSLNWLSWSFQSSLSSLGLSCSIPAPVRPLYPCQGLSECERFHDVQMWYVFFPSHIFRCFSYGPNCVLP